MNFLFASISTIISNFKGEMPLANYLKKYFKLHPKLGSRDRKSITEAVYTYYRYAGFFNPEQDTLNTIHQGMEIGDSENNYLKDNYEKIKETLLPKQEFKIEHWKYFSSFSNALSKGIEMEGWLNSMATQPNLFVRIRLNTENAIQKLTEAKFNFQIISDLENKVDCYSFKNATKLDAVLKPNEFVVQDWSSQRSIAILRNLVDARFGQTSKLTVWDVCAGAGGKSIFWKEKRAADFLMATDIRLSALKNLKERFSTYNMEHFQALGIDVTNRSELSKKLKKQRFDVVICDVPCSGSGTWARTPEDFYFFNPESLAAYAEKQYNIAFEAQRQLKETGYFAYITCSIFKAENEEVVSKLLATTNLKLVEQKLINGIEQKSDSMFVAIFQF